MSVRKNKITTGVGLVCKVSLDQTTMLGDDLVRFLRGQPTQTEFGLVMASLLRNR